MLNGMNPVRIIHIVHAEIEPAVSAQNWHVLDFSADAMADCAELADIILCVVRKRRQRF